MSPNFFRTIASHTQDSKTKSLVKQNADQRESIDAGQLARCSSEEARALIPYEQAQKLGVLPLGLIRSATDEVLLLACAEQADHQLHTSLRFLCEKPCKFVQVPSASLEKALYYAYRGSEQTLLKRVEQVREPEIFQKKDRLIDFHRANSDAAALLCSLVDYAIAHAASDLHMLPLKDGCHVKVRIGGVLRSHALPICPHSTYQQIVNRVKVLSGNQNIRKDLPIDGVFNIALGSEYLQVRVSLMPTLHGDKLVLRLPCSTRLMKIQDLGFSTELEEELYQAMAITEGAILFSGPTGSGKSTSMYAILAELAGRNLNCVTLEDPVETHLENVSQSSINPELGLTYASALRSTLRQDPDVILLGEIRDSESACSALQAAITGHLLLSTVHARSPFEVLLRLKSLGVDELTMAQACNLILTQLLVPTLCRKCRILDLQISNLRSHPVYRDTGCSECDYTGFNGRLLLAEGFKLEEHSRQLLMRAEWDKLAGRLEEERSSSNSISRQATHALEQGRINIKQFTWLAARS